MIRNATSLLLLLILVVGAAFARPATAQVVGSPFGTGGWMQQYSSNTGPGGFLNSYTVQAGSTAAFCALSLGQAAGYPFPLDAAAGDLYLDPTMLIEIAPMVNISSATDWGHVFNLPNDPTITGLTIYAQIMWTDAVPLWHLTTAWATTLT